MLIIFILFSLTSSEFLSIKTPSDQQVTPSMSLIPNLSQSVGSNCGYTNIFNISGVYISPWPPQGLGTVATINIVGVFIKGDYIQEIVFGTCYNSMFWEYVPTDVDLSYETGQQVMFTINQQFPSYPGNYISNIQLTAGYHICCWQFSYIVS
ncbi:hypothetical protein SteCoe_5076 [Stentor coeruleus]|uniref:Uncharacterized protein n=1 Tax=Stentor coeruleus TaxID=5963 RepID=A0A1R2CT83_9CILI|nr:hypothetical protein SteCoe_5076 [Stentor coeruleus]